MAFPAVNSAGLAQSFSTVTNADGTISSGISTEGQKATYMASATGLVPAASATDIVTIAGSATKTIKVTRIIVSGTAGTLVSLPVLLYKRATADTAGTPATNLALPVAVKLDSTDIAATAGLNSYTANPTINDASANTNQIWAQNVTFPVTSAGTSIAPAVFDFGTRNGRACVLRGTAQQLCVNLSAVSVSSGLLNVTLEWTEE